MKDSYRYLYKLVATRSATAITWQWYKKTMHFFVHTYKAGRDWQCSLRAHTNEKINKLELVQHTDVLSLLSAIAARKSTF